MFVLSSCQCSNVKKEEPERSVSERRRCEVRRRRRRRSKARRVSMQLGGLGSNVSSPSGSGLSPAAKRHLVHFWSENALSGKALEGYCKCLLTRNCQQIVPVHYRVRLIHQRKISFLLSVSHLTIGRSKFSPLLICGKVIKSHSEREILCLMTPTHFQVQRI